MSRSISEWHVLEKICFLAGKPLRIEGVWVIVDVRVATHAVQEHQNVGGGRNVETAWNLLESILNLNKIKFKLT